MRTIFTILLLSLGPLLAGRSLVVSLPPQAGIARALVGEGWTVRVALPAGVDHENFSPTPGQVRQLHEADIYWASGMGFERLLLPRLQATHTDLVVVAPAEGGHACGGHDHGHGDHHQCHGHDGEGDLHRWMNPALVREDAAALLAALVGIDPENRADYEARYAAFAERCGALEAELRAALRPYAGEAIYVYHAAYGHLAALGGLRQVALEREGREPSLRDLRELIEAARGDGVRVVYTQPQYRQSSAETLARAIDAEVVSLDPLAEDWEDNLRAIARRFAEELGTRKDKAR
jgi:zinc transport system substrate-binding protein